MPTRNPRTVVTFPIVLRELTVVRVTDVTPGMRRVTLGGTQLSAFHRDGLDLPALRSEGFDDHVKFFFAADGRDLPVLPRQNISSLDWPADERPIAKDYTPRRYDPEAGEIDFDFVRHGNGPAASWAEQAIPGQTVWIAGPKMSHHHPEGADWILIAGDETALPAIGRWLAEMPEGVKAKVFVEISDDTHRQDLPTRADADITWLSRQGAPAGTTDLLEQAVRQMDWLPGVVFAWAAGEALSLKGLRRHLTADRQVPREQTHITGYWRLTQAPHAPGGPEEDGAHERLHELTDLAPGFAIRAAVTLGLVNLVHSGACEPAALAARTSTDLAGLTALMDYLVAIEVFATGPDGRYRLTPVGEELVEDDHSAEEYHLGGARAALDLSLSGLVRTLRTGRAGYRTQEGRPLVAAMPSDARLGGSAREAVEESARWVAPGVLAAYDWGAVKALTAAGNGAATIVNALVKAEPGLRVRIAAMPSALGVLRERILDADVLPRVELLATTGQAPPGGDDTVLLAHALTWLPDEDAELLLAETAGRLPPGGTLIMVEEFRPDGLNGPDAVLHDLQLRCAFGSGLRPASRIAELAERAGLRVRSARDIGWDHRMWVMDVLPVDHPDAS
ncbi:siderophore-interacting protein [Nonomuraea longicatena]|uniref:FAD-binding FR-type domain-containing protein n=1 Tax=Nonomuraea longicatena TaxID=83682 RepID=A0ABN1QB15_9ACTN